MLWSSIIISVAAPMTKYMFRSLDTRKLFLKTLDCQ